MSTLSTVYMKQSQRVSAAHVAGWPPSLDDATGAGQFPSYGPSEASQVQISGDARMQALGLDGTLETVQPMLMDKLQGNLLNMMLERLTGESMAHEGFTFPTATADAFGWFAERYGVPRPPRHRPQSFTGTMASITAQSQSVQLSTKTLVSDADGKNVNLSMELSMAKTSVGVSVAALQNSPMSGPQIASFGGRSSQATHASFQFNLGVLWSGVSVTAGAQTASNSHGEGSPVTFGASSRSIQRAFFASVNARYNDVDTQPTPPRATPSVSSVVREPAATTATASLATAVAEPTTQELEERPTKLPKATKRWIA
jgi:hypothetical protein